MIHTCHNLLAVDERQAGSFRKRCASRSHGLFLLLVIILIVSPPLSARAEEPSRIDLTPEEQAWLAEHPEIVLGSATDYPPMVIKRADGTHVGMLVDYFEEVNRYLNSRIRLHVEDSWADVQEKAKNREIDGLAFGARDPKRDAYFNATDVVLSTYFSVFARSQSDHQLKKFADLDGMLIGYKRAARPTRSLLEKLPAATLKPYDDHEFMTQALLSREIDVIVAWMSYDHWRKEKLQGTIDNIYLIREHPIEMVTYIRNDWPELIPIMNKTIATLQRDALPRIINKWFGEWPQLSKVTSVSLTPEERAWLDKKHTVRVRVVDFPPFMITKKGKDIRGITIDYLNLIASRTGIQFKYSFTTVPFSEALEKMKNKEGPDLIANMIRTPDREKTISFSKSYYAMPRVIFTRTDEQFISGMDDILEKTIAVPRGTQIQKEIQMRYPDIKLGLFDTDWESLEAVATGQADAYVGNLTLATYINLQKGFTNLKVAAPTPFGDHVFSFGSRKDWPELSSIINKGLDSITPEEKTQISNKYFSLRYEHGVTPADILKWVLIVAGVASGVVLVFVVWNKQLGRKVKERTSQLMETEQRFRSTFEQAAVGIAHVSTDGKFLRVNRKFSEIVGYSEKEILDLTFQDITHLDDLAADLDYVRQVLNGKRETYSTDKRYFRKDGSIVWINLTVSLVFDREGNPIYFVSVIKDISERKQAETALQQSHGLLKHLISSIPDAVFSVKLPERVILWAEDSYNIMGLGRNPEYVQGQSTRGFFADIDEYNAFGEIQRKAILEGKRFMRTEIMLRRTDGSIFPADVTGTFYREKGEVTKITAMVRDISDRRKAEEKLTESEAKYRGLVDNSIVGVFTSTLDGRFTFVNDALARMYDFDSPEEMIAHGSLERWKDLKERERLLAELKEHGSVANFEAETITNTDRHIHVIFSVKQQGDTMFGMVMDITGRKLAEDELQKAYQEVEHLQKQLQAESAYLQDEIKLEHNFENIIGQSEALKYVLHRIEQIAPLDSTVLILGETGTGKELIARALHKLSSRSKRPLVKVNCAALPGELIESELFGREKGAFTGATTTQIGRFELANESTLFLDEIGEVPFALQAKLLRVLESGEFERLGSSRTLHTDVRIIAATNRNLEEEVRNKRFREDLLYRLKIFPITLPPLRDRLGDIPLLVNSFVKFFARKMGKRAEAARISRHAMQALQSYSWPGNVRELMHVVESALITVQGNKLHFDLPKTADVETGNLKSFEEMEREYILDVLKAKNWKIGGEDSAASILGMPSSTLRSRIKKLGLQRPGH